MKPITLSGLSHFKDKLESKWKLKFDQVYNKTEVDELITAKVAEIVAGAPEDFNTLKEMSDWLAEHEDSAAAMNSAIQKNAEDIASANTEIAKKIDKVSGKSLISDSEITRLAGVDNYDDTAVNTQITDIYNRCGGGKNLYDISDKTTTVAAYIMHDISVSFSCDSVIVSFDFVGKNGVNTLRLLDASGNIISSSATNPASGGRGSVVLESAKKATKMRWWADGYGTFSNIMIRPAYVKDDTFVPYVPTSKKLYEAMNNHIKTFEKTMPFTGISFERKISFTIKPLTTVQCRTPIRLVFTSQYGNESPKELLLNIDTKTGSSVGRGVLIGYQSDGTITLHKKTMDDGTVIYTLDIGRNSSYGNFEIELNRRTTDFLLIGTTPTFISDDTEGATKITIWSLQEQINQLITRIAALEGSTATTEE